MLNKTLKGLIYLEFISYLKILFKDINMKSVGFIGAGNMTYALVGAFLKKNKGIQINLSDPSEERCDLFKRDFGTVNISASNQALVDESDIIFLAVKPQVIPLVLESINDPKKTVVSIAAGVSVSALQALMPESFIVRVMPNTPCLVGEMAAGVTYSDLVNDDDKLFISELLSSAGTAITVSEDKMDAVTALSGSGPAFVARIIEGFIKAGVTEGLNYDDAYKLGLATFSGTAKLLKEMTPEDLITMVSSPNGTTVAGRAVLESSNYQTIINETLAAVSNRSKELGK